MRTEKFSEPVTQLSHQPPLLFFNHSWQGIESIDDRRLLQAHFWISLTQLSYVYQPPLFYFTHSCQGTESSDDRRLLQAHFWIGVGRSLGQDAGLFP